jgi:hypothetical protein
MRLRFSELRCLSVPEILPCAAKGERCVLGLSVLECLHKFSRACGDIFPDMSADADDPKSYNFGPADRLIASIKGVGAETIFRIGRSIGADPLTCRPITAPILHSGPPTASQMPWAVHSRRSE